MSQDDLPITPLQAIHYRFHSEDFADFLTDEGLDPRTATRALNVVYGRATPDDHATYEWLINGREDLAATKAAVAFARVPHREDAEQLARYLETARRVPQRLREVFQICFRDGATETVRSHLRRLRLLARRHAEAPSPGGPPYTR